MTVAERAAELKQKSDEVKATYAKMYEMGKDVAGAGLRAEKTEVATIRTELQKEIDDQTKAMKDGLARILDTRVTAYATQADNMDQAATLRAMLTPMAAKDSANPLGEMWDEYAEYVKDVRPGHERRQAGRDRPGPGRGQGPLRPLAGRPGPVHRRAAGDQGGRDLAEGVRRRRGAANAWNR